MRLDYCNISDVSDNIRPSSGSQGTFFKCSLHIFSVIFNLRICYVIFFASERIPINKILGGLAPHPIDIHRSWNVLSDMHIDDATLTFPKIDLGQQDIEQGPYTPGLYIILPHLRHLNRFKEAAATWTGCENTKKLTLYLNH